MHVINKHVPAKITNAHIIMNVQKIQQVVEIELHGSHADIYAKFSAEDMYTAIDKVVDKIESQIVKHKERYGQRKHSGSPSIRTREIEEEEAEE
jgi:putative sigma-54 modulation protein